MKRALVCYATVALAFSCLGFAQDDAAQEEDTTTFERGTFEALDADADGALAPGEFGTGFFTVAAAGEIQIDPERFEAVVAALTPLGLDVTFEGVDVNGDGAITDDQEFIPAVATSVFEAWDENGDDQLSEEEYLAGWFGLMDTDGDGQVTEAEYMPFEDWFGASFAAFGAAAGEGVAQQDFDLRNDATGN